MEAWVRWNSAFRAPAGEKNEITYGRLCQHMMVVLYLLYTQPQISFKNSITTLRDAWYEVCDMNSHITWPYQIADHHCKITWVYNGVAAQAVLYTRSSVTGVDENSCFYLISVQYIQ